MSDEDARRERDYQAYQGLIELWSRENSIKTTKLQTLLAVNALLISAVAVSGGPTASKWYLYLAGAVFCLIWTLSIGRTALFQDVWQIKMAALREGHPDDPRFALLETRQARGHAAPLMRAFGFVPSKWYLLFTPFLFALAWLGILVASLV